MANRFQQPLRVGEFDPQAQPLGQTATVPRQYDGSQTTGALAVITEKLANKFARYADQAAQVEGQRAGQVAGADPNFRPSGSMTIRGRSADLAATEVYASNLTTKLNSEMADAFDANRDNPAAFAAKAREIQTRYQRDNVFPEIAADFNHRFSSLELAYRTKVGDNYRDLVESRQRANLTSDLDTASTNRTRVLAAGLNPDTQKQVDQSLADDDARIDGLVAGGAYTPEQGQKLKSANRHNAAYDMAIAGAAKAKTPDEIEAYRAQLKAEFIAGKRPDLSGDNWQAIDAGLGKLATAARTGSNAAVKDLDKDMDGYLDRLTDGLPPSAAELAGITEKANALGPQGSALMQRFERRQAFARRIAGQSPEQTDAMIQALIDDAKRTGAIDRSALIVPASANIGRVDPRLVDIMQFAAGASGLKVSVTPQGGANRRRAGTTNHPNGRAVDVSLVKDGKRLGNYQDPGSFRSYEQFAQLARKYQMQKYPELEKNFRWGGYFLGRFSADSMHFDLSGSDGLGMAGGSWEGGLNASGRARLPGVESAGIDNAPLPSAAGISPGLGEDIQWARKIADQRRKDINEDPLGAAQKSGVATEIRPYDPDAGDAPEQLSRRVSQAEAIGQQTGREPTYLRPEEKRRLSARLAEGGDDALGVLQGIVAGGGTAAPRILKELGSDAPVMAQAGAVLAAGGSVTAVRDAMAAIKLKKDGSDLPSPPKSMMQDTADTMGRALDLNPDERGRVTQLANLIYAARATRNNLGKDDDAEATKLYQRAIQEAAGATFNGNGNQFGGFVKLERQWFGTRPAGMVAVPPGMSAQLFPQVLDNIRDEDLTDLKVPPLGANGQPFHASDLAAALPVRFGAGYRFQAIDPQTGEQAYVRGADGRPFVLPIDTLRTVQTVRFAAGDLQ